jgi:hypothetical protein
MVERIGRLGAVELLAIGPMALEIAWADPWEFVAVSTTVMVPPTSPAVRV